MALPTLLDTIGSLPTCFWGNLGPVVGTAQGGRMSWFLMVLPFMEQKRALYMAFGFKEIPPYHSNPRVAAIFIELGLRCQLNCTANEER